MNDFSPGRTQPEAIGGILPREELNLIVRAIRRDILQQYKSATA
jgi:hypothetical protein